MKISTIRTGDIVLTNLNPTRGHEKQKVRPCVVLEGEASILDLFIAVPITEDKGQRSEIFVRLAQWRQYGLKKPSVVDAYQLRAMDFERVIAKQGTVSEAVLDQIKCAVARILNIETRHIV